MSDQKDQVKDAAEEVKEAAEEVKEAAEKVGKGKTEAAGKEAEKAEEKAEEAAEKAESASAKASADKETKKEKPEPTGKFKDIIKDIESLSALELSELVKALEERFGVSAAAPVAVAGPAAAGAPAEGGDEEKSNYTVVLAAPGGNKIATIKAVRECAPDLGLKEAKDLVDGAPKTVKENVPTEEAKGMKEKLEAAGATVELK